jgi:hypothetical protein
VSPRPKSKIAPGRLKRAVSGDGLLAHIQSAETQAHRDGFVLTARALNRARNVFWWEMAGEPEQAAKAARRS